MPENQQTPKVPEGFDPTGGVFDEAPQTPVVAPAAVPTVVETPAAAPNESVQEIPAVAPAPAIPPEQVIEILRQAGHFPAPQQPVPVVVQQAPAPPTREQLEAQFEVFKPTEALVKKLLNLENPADAVAAITEIRDGMTRQMVRIQQAMVEEALRPVQAQFQAFNEFKQKQEQLLAEQESERFEANFYKDYPEFSTMKPLVDAVTSKLGEVKGTAKERAKVYAEAVKGTLTACGITAPAVSGAAPAAGRVTTTRQGSSMATLTSGGHPGTRTAASTSKKYEGPYAAAHEVLDS